MEVPNSAWTLVGAGADASLVVQNVGVTRIAYVFAASLPAADAIALDTDAHFIMAPGSEPVTVKELNTLIKNMYARSLGPKAGSLAVEAN